MPNLALESSGASVSLSTAWDKNHIAENVIDGKDDTFWTTTGLFPHELIISFATPISVQNVTVFSSGLKRVALERTENEDPTAFEKIYECGMLCFVFLQFYTLFAFVDFECIYCRNGVQRWETSAGESANTAKYVV